MASIAIFRINYKSDFILTLHSDAGWLTPFCIKFWTGAPSQAYYAGYDGTTYTHCAPVEGDPTKLSVQFDDHHLSIGDLKFQIGYHFTVADFPNDTEDEVLNQASVIIEKDDKPMQVMLDLNGETAPEIEFSLPAYANEAQRIANEEQRINDEQQRISNEEGRISAEEGRQAHELQRIHNEETRIEEFAQLKADAISATGAANNAATLANDKADLAQQKADYAQTQGDYAKAQGDYAKAQGDYAKAQGDTALADHERAEADHDTSTEDHTQASSDHDRAESDHSQAAQDHDRAESDHAAVEVYVDSLGAFDISSYHATDGVLAKYADLAAALGTNGANIPDDLRKGGMSVKFVQSSDNKYVQARCMAQSFTTDVTQWQGVDDEPTANSENLVKSRGVDKAIDGVIGTSNNYISGNVNSNGAIVSSNVAVVSPYIPINIGDVIEWHAGRKGVSARLAMYGEDFNSLSTDAWAIDNQPNPFRVVTVSDLRQYKYLRAAFALDSIDKAYIKINGEVVYAPKPASEGKLGKLVNTVSIVGNGNNGVYSNRIAGLIAGHTYRVHVKNPNIPMSNVTTSTEYFRLWGYIYLDDVQVSGYPFSVYIGQAIKDYYDIVVPTDGKNYSMNIGMRANYGEEQILIVEDITTSNAFAKEEAAKENSFTTISLVGDNNNNVYGFIPAVAGRVYKVSIKTLDIDMSGVTYSSGDHSRLQLCVTDGNNKNSNIIKSNNFVPVTIHLSEYYFIRVPEGNDNCYIRISMRATAGEYQVFRIEDVTVEANNKLESLKRGQTVRLSRMELNMLFDEYEATNNKSISYTYKGNISTASNEYGLTYYKIPYGICGGISLRQYKTSSAYGSYLIDEDDKLIFRMVNHRNMTGVDFLSPDIAGWSYILYAAYQTFDNREDVYVVLSPFTEPVKQLQNEISPSIVLNDGLNVESEHHLKILSKWNTNGIKKTDAVGRNLYDVLQGETSSTGVLAVIVDCDGYDSIDASAFKTSSDYIYGMVTDESMNVLDAYYNRLESMAIVNNKLPDGAKYFIYIVYYTSVLDGGSAYIKLNKNGLKEQVESNSTRITTLEEKGGTTSATSVVTLNQGNIGEDGYPIASDKHVYTSPVWGGHGIFMTILDGYEIHQAHLYDAKGNLVAYDYVPPKTVTSGPLSPIIGDGLRFFYSTDTIASGYYLVFVFTKVVDDTLADISKDEFIIDKFCYLDDANLHKMEVNGAYYKYAQDRIKQLAWVRWIPQENMISTGTNKDPYFYKKGRMRFGIPYSEASEYTKYVGQNVTPYTFLTAIHNRRSVMYTERIGSSPTSKYGISYHGLGGFSFNYYGTVCTGLTGFIPWWKNLYVSGKYPNKNNNGVVPNLTKVLNANAQNVQPLDFIWKEGHCIIIKDIILDDQGNRKFIVIAEQIAPSTCITAYTPEMFEKRLEVQECVVSRWSKWAEESPASESTPYIQMDWMDYPRDIAYNDDICTFLGDKPCIAVGDPMFLNMNRTKGYTTLVIQMLQNDEWVNVGNNIDISSLDADTLYPSDTEDWCTLDITENITVTGKYRAYLTGDGGLQSEPTQWEAINIIMHLTETSGGFSLDFTSGGTPYLLRHERTDGMELENHHYEITDNDITAGTISKNWAKPSGSTYPKSYIKLFVRGEYGTAVKRVLYKDE